MSGNDEEDLKDLLQIYDAIGREIYALRDSVKSREDVKKSRYPISDHAVLRWLERVHGLDVDAIKREILTPDRIAAVKLGAHRVRCGDYVLVIADHTVVTVLANEQLKVKSYRHKEYDGDDDTE